MIYSDTVGKMIPRGFKVKLKSGDYRHYTWCESDAIYWADDVDDRYRDYDDIPSSAIMDK